MRKYLERALVAEVINILRRSGHRPCLTTVAQAINGALDFREDFTEERVREALPVGSFVYEDGVIL